MLVPSDYASTAADSDSECSSQDELSDAALPQRLATGTETLGASWLNINMARKPSEELFSASDTSSTGSFEREVRVLRFSSLKRGGLYDLAAGQDEVEDLTGDEADEPIFFVTQADELHQSMASQPSAFDVLIGLFWEGARGRYSP